MKYNKAGTVYHKAARRLLHSGLKQLTPAKLRPLGTILTYMYEIPIRELGFDIGKMDVVCRNNYNINKDVYKFACFYRYCVDRYTLTEIEIRGGRRCTLLAVLIRRLCAVQSHFSLISLLVIDPTLLDYL